ncbi:MAG TPA: efflux RND transporter periplasmic adaptor subunit [Gemmataceae bacterium]|nr:efflux RND transporter periplasmic adaptor subunit [Gemmataceae bacterium]
MINRHQLSWRTGSIVLLTSVLYGCGNADVPVAETPPPPVSVSQPLVRDVVDQDDYQGYIAAIPMVEVRARVRGHLIKVNFEDGQMVKKGDLLYEIDPRPYESDLKSAESQKAAADAAYKLARATANRDRRLNATGAVSAQELDVSLGKEGVSQADVAKAQAAIGRVKLDLEYTKITAPFTGKISRTLVDVGNLVNAGGGETLLTTITSVDPIYVYFEVDERALMRYRQHFRKGGTEGGAEPSVKDLKVPVMVGLEGEKGYPHTGVIDFADNKVNRSTGTIQVRGELRNAKRILDAGMSARVRVPVSDPHKSLLITERAIGTDQGRKFVYVVTDQKVAERRDIQLGRLSDGLQVIHEGLKPEDWIIVNGIQRVRDQAKVDPKQIAMPGAPAEPTTSKTKS